MRWLLQSGNFPAGCANDVALLLDDAQLLKNLFVEHLMSAPAGPVKDIISNRAERVGNLANKLVKDIEDRGRSIVSKEPDDEDSSVSVECDNPRILNSADDGGEESVIDPKEKTVTET